MKKLLFLLLFALSSLLVADEAPFAIYLTWHDDPTSTMCINIIEEESSKIPSIEYQKKTDREWKKALPSSGFSEEPYSIYSFYLSHLKADTTYRFRISGYDVEHLFATMPNKLKSPLSFVVGGDINLNSSSGPLFEETNRQVVHRNPAFIAIGGDIACSGTNPFHTQEDDRRWFTWFSIWYKTMITEEGRLIPLLVSIGNHDVSGGHDQTPQEARLFYKFFRAEGERGYRVARFGSYLSLYLLDSNHTTPIKGFQSLWLAAQMYLDRKVPHKVAVYHVSAYPPVRSFSDRIGSSIRHYWAPIFDTLRLHLAFEHHEHAYKRTTPISFGSACPFGVTYIGNGPWGKRPRSPRTGPLFDKTAQIRGFSEVTIYPHRRDVQAFNFDGTVIDSFSQETDDRIIRHVVEQERKLSKMRPVH